MCERATPIPPIVFSSEEKVVEAEIDRVRLRQVVSNLVKNAQEATANGKVSVQCKTRDDFVEIVVEDDGPGIPDELAGRIYEPFFSTKEGGLGLGLSICVAITQAHGGTLEGSTSSNGGAAFTVRLPRARSMGEGT